MANQETKLPSSYGAQGAGDETVTELLSRALVRAGQPEQTVEVQEDEAQVDLIALFWQVIGKIQYVVLAAVIGALIAGVYAWYIRVPTYAATSKLYIMSNNNSAINLSDLQIGAALAPDYKEVYKTWEVHEMVRENLGLGKEYTNGRLQGNLSITTPTSTRLLYITYTDPDPDQAQRIANAYAAAGQKFIVDTMDSREPSLFSSALRPAVATGRSKTVILIIGLLVGALLAVAVIVATFLLDNRPRTPDDITRITNLPILAVVPLQDKNRRPGNSRHQSGSGHSHSGHSSHSSSSHSKRNGGK